MREIEDSVNIPAQISDVPDKVSHEISAIHPDSTPTITPLNHFFQIGYVLALVAFCIGILLSWFSVVSIYVLLCIPVCAALYSAWQASKTQDWTLFASILTCLISLAILFILKH